MITIDTHTFVYPPYAIACCVAQDTLARWTSDPFTAVISDDGTRLTAKGAFQDKVPSFHRLPIVDA